MAYSMDHLGRAFRADDCLEFNVARLVSIDTTFTLSLTDFEDSDLEILVYTR